VNTSVTDRSVNNWNGVSIRSFLTLRRRKIARKVQVTKTVAEEEEEEEEEEDEEEEEEEEEEQGEEQEEEEEEKEERGKAERSTSCFGARYGSHGNHDGN